MLMSVNTTSNALVPQGYNGSQLWDTSFAVQAMLDTGLVDVAAAALKKAHSYIEQSQVRRC
jgi:cycloartenol synthase